MSNITKKLSQLKWLQYHGILYYCSTEKYSKKLIKKEVKELSAAQNQHKYKIQSTPIHTTIEPKIDKNINSSTLDLIYNARILAESSDSLDELRLVVENFQGCVLKQFATNTVFGDGQIDAKILIIGEAPGASEDQQGIPFCGASGQLLDNMLNTIGLSRKKNIYMTNTVFWRPPANRKPTDTEIAICKPFLEKQIQLLDPKLIILVGNTAATTLLQQKEKISSIRRTFYHYTNKYLTQPVSATVIFHPSFLLRSPYKKKDTWFDLLNISDHIHEMSM